MEVPWIALIAAFVGSSGIIGGLTLAVQHSRAARLRRSIREALELADAFQSGSRPQHALTAAATLDAYRLASMSLTRLRSRAISVMLVLVATVVVVLVVLGLTLERSGSSMFRSLGLPTWVLLSVYGATYVLALVWVLDRSLRRRRDELVRRLMASGRFTLGYSEGGSEIVEDGAPAPATAEVG